MSYASAADDGEASVMAVQSRLQRMYAKKLSPDVAVLVGRSDAGVSSPESRPGQGFMRDRRLPMQHDVVQEER